MIHANNTPRSCVVRPSVTPRNQLDLCNPHLALTVHLPTKKKAYFKPLISSPSYDTLFKLCRMLCFIYSLHTRLTSPTNSDTQPLTYHPSNSTTPPSKPKFQSPSNPSAQPSLHVHVPSRNDSSNTYGTPPLQASPPAQPEIAGNHH